MRILIVVPEQDRISGNWVSAMRFQQGLALLGHQAIVEETRLKPEPGFRRQILDFAPDVAILLHAYRSGKPWLEAIDGFTIPTVVLLTGTDINHGLDDPEQQQDIRSCLQQATFVLLQNPLLANELSSSHPELTANLYELPPGIRLGTEAYPLRDKHHLAKAKTLFLCPAGLRQVKGVLELLEMFDLVAARSSQAVIAFCGPILEEEYGQRFLSALETRPWAHYLGPIPTQTMASAMREADVVINNSQTEGLANSLLEAATLGIPILAHKIPGNLVVVRHEINGLLYTSQEDFVKYAAELLSPERRQELSRPEPSLYSPEEEALALHEFLQQTVPKAKLPALQRSRNFLVDNSKNKKDITG
jgi:glycosyltransferase involved in cell wall biosynthesis